MAANSFKLHFSLHWLGGDMGLAVLPNDPLFMFHHNSLDRLRRQWMAQNEHLRPLAYGYPVHARAVEKTLGGLDMGLYDCLGCNGGIGSPLEAKERPGFIKEARAAPAAPRCHPFLSASSHLAPPPHHP